MDKTLVKSAVIGGLVGGLSALGLYCLVSHGKSTKKTSTQIVRLGTDDPRASKVVVHDGKVYISGQVGDIPKLEESDIKEQTKQTLAKIDAILAGVGIGRDRILEARIWLRNMSVDFQAMNEIWNAWVDPNNKGTSMKLKELERYLQQVEGFSEPKIGLEQYITSGHIASHMLFTIDQTFGDITNQVVADFGCGCGVLSIGCGMLDAGQVFGYDICEDALDVAQRNINDFDMNSSIDLLRCDLQHDSHMWKYVSSRRIIDTVVMNPPFGTKNNKGIDVLFLERAISVAQNSVYSLHKTTTRDYVTKKAEDLNCTVEVLAELRYDLPKSYRFHKKQSLDIHVDLIRCVPNG